MDLISLGMSALGNHFITFVSSVFSIVIVSGFFAFVVKSLVS